MGASREQIVDRKPFEWTSEASIEDQALEDDYHDLMKDEFARTIIHFGEGRLNPSTIACILAEIEKKLAHRHEITLPEAVEYTDIAAEAAVPRPPGQATREGA